MRGVVILALLWAGCASALAREQIAVSLAATRVVGVAPLSVFFDASGTTAEGLTAQPFHDLHYVWDFGDPASGAWSHGSRRGTASRNVAGGPLALHVFERAGTYTVTLTVSHGENRSTATQRIAVRDPEAFYVGDLTRCLANSANPDWTGCPPGAVRVASSSDFAAAVRSHLRGHRRLLFRRGDRWTSASPATLEANGPWTIAAFGTGARPSVAYPGGGEVFRVGMPSLELRDGRIVDLDLDAGRQGRGATCARGFGRFDDLLFLRVNCRNVNIGFWFDGLNATRLAHVWSGLALVEVTVSGVGGSGGNAFFGTAAKFAAIGSSFTDSAAGAGEHNFRSMYMNKAVIADNLFADPNEGKHNLVIRAPDYYRAYNPAIPAGTASRLVLIAGNEFRGGPVRVQSTLNACDDTAPPHDQRCADFIVERNWWSAGSSTQVAINLFSMSRASIRNNIIDTSDSAVAAYCMAVSNGSSVSRAVAFYNNSCFTRNTAGNRALISIGPGVRDTVARNNVDWASGARNALGVRDMGVDSRISNNSTAGQQNGAASPFARQAPVTPEDFAAASYARGAGVTVPVWGDFFNAAPPARRDLGAVNH